MIRNGIVRFLPVVAGCLAVLLVGTNFMGNGGGEEPGIERSTRPERDGTVVREEASATLACAGVPRIPILKDGKYVYHDISVTMEDVCIVWDPKSKTEHFIRRANFESESEDFGFLVPTPSKPELGEANQALFQRLETAVKPESIPKVRSVIKWSLFSLLFPKKIRAKTVDSSNPEEKRVEVLERKIVGG